MRLGDYFRLMKENRFKIHPIRYPMFALGGGCALINSILAQVQDVTHGSLIESAQLKKPPIFIVGHWRSGTTLMHELMSMDSRLAFPTNFDAFIPNHFLASRFFFYPFLKLLMPRQRPMDNMSMGVGSPQEDDFALCAYGAPTPYRRIAFPNQLSREHLNLKLSDADNEVNERLHEAMNYFLKALTVRYDSQLVLKSPPHTGRLEQLAEWFPGAKFVHMARHPHKLVPSTMRLWKLLDSLQGFQIPRYDDTWLKNYIFECKDLMYSSYFDQRESIPRNQLVEVNFEKLTANPILEMERVYDQLEMDRFGELEPALVEYFERKKNHQKNPFILEPSLELEIDNNWHRYMDVFGYASQSERSMA